MTIGKHLQNTLIRVAINDDMKSGNKQSGTEKEEGDGHDSEASECVDGHTYKGVVVPVAETLESFNSIMRLSIIETRHLYRLPERTCKAPAVQRVH